MAREKKFFAPILRTYNNNLSKRWRVEYWEPITATRCKRVVLYGHINKGNDVEERTRFAFQLINALDFYATPDKNILEKSIEQAAMRLRPKTIAGYSTIAQSFKEYLGKGAPETATEQTVNGFLLNLHKNGMNQNTISKYRISLHAIYSKAIADGFTAYNPVRKVPGIKKSPKSLQFFSDEQINQIKSATAGTQLWLAIRLLYYCFIRPTELRGLRIGHINLEYGFIEVPGEISKNKKTEKVSIPTHFLKEIEYLKMYPNSFFVLSKTNVPGTEQIAQNHLYNAHYKVLDNLRIRGHYSFYSWKHTGVVKAVKAGINIKDLQLQLRHHSLDMVNEYLKNLGVMDSEDLRNKFPTL